MSFGDTVRSLPSFRGYLREVYAALRRTPPSTSLSAIDDSLPMFAGDFPSWKAAIANCEGYDSRAIFEKTKAAALAVRDGTAAFERDSVLFIRPEFRWEAMAAILWQAARDRGDLGVMDFGGSLGSVYFQSRLYLAGLPAVKWGVVEQEHYVEFGNRELASDVLRFFLRVEECANAIQPNVVFFGAVLQYLQFPFTVLESILSLRAASIVFDRLAVFDQPEDRLTIQRVPEEIYNASYPAWFFSESRFLRFMEEGGYRLQSECRNIDHYPLEGGQTAFKGYHFVRRD